ncbi:hypothetical protein Taro_053234, partial [Colocasia esculenta]|nr:hypothetical protein [Colocasia esculenta]
LVKSSSARKTSAVLVLRQRCSVQPRVVELFSSQNLRGTHELLNSLVHSIDICKGRTVSPLAKSSSAQKTSTVPVLKQRCSVQPRVAELLNSQNLRGTHEPLDTGEFRFEQNVTKKEPQIRLEYRTESYAARPRASASRSATATASSSATATFSSEAFKATQARPRNVGSPPLASTATSSSEHTSRHCRSTPSHAICFGLRVRFGRPDSLRCGGATPLHLRAAWRGRPQDLFNAGTDTSSSTVEWTLAELVRHPDILEAAQRELDAVAGHGRLVSESDLARCPLVHAIVKETLRLHPPTPLSLPHVASEACDVAGYHVPKGATLLVNVWAIGRDPSVWDDPLEFRPDRFLPGGRHAHVDVRGNHFEVIPFGAGRRICAGVSLALRVVHLATATLIHGFDWAMPAGQAPEKLDMEEAYGLTLQRAVPLRLRPVPRLHHHVYTAAAA